MRILYIDTSNNKKVVVSLVVDGKKDVLEQESTIWKSQAVLPLISKMLEKHSLTLQDIEGIDVHAGPGSFTGLRVGVAIANTLATWLKIPVNDKPVGEIVEPTYQ